MWRQLRQRANRRTFAARNTLRDLYRYALAHGAADTPVPDAFIRGVGERSAESGLRELMGAGRVRLGAAGWQLSERGIALAQRDFRNQRLWELYRLHGHALDLPIVAEDRERDITTLLPAAAVARLEAKLAERAHA